MNTFDELLKLYGSVKKMMSAICARGGLDIDNYSGRFFAADLLDLLVVCGEKAKADVSALRVELESQRGLLTPSNKPIYEMTLAEFEKLLSAGN